MAARTVCRIWLSFVVALGVCLAALVVPAAGGSGEGVDDPRAMLSAIGQYALSLEDMLEGGPTELEAVLEKVGLEAELLADWVHGNVGFEPYGGIMKGARGALVARRANAADQALLLATLLEHAGTAAELVRGEVDADALPAPSLGAWEEEPVEPDAATLAEIAARTGVTPEALAGRLRSARIARERFLEDLWSRTLYDLEVTAAALDAAGVPVPRGGRPVPAGESVEHWWVRTPEGDFDPVLGNVRGRAADAFAISELPDDVFHLLTVRLLIQRGEGDRAAPELAEPEDVLEVTFRTPDLFGEEVALSSVPLDVAEELSALAESAPGDLLESLARATQFQPQLRTPQGMLPGHPFDLSGNKLEVRRGRVEAVRDIGVGITGLFGPRREEPPPTWLAGYWMELSLEGPEAGGRAVEPITVRRDILRSPEGRQAVFDVLATRELLVMPDELSEDWMGRRFLRYTAQWAEFAQDFFARAEFLREMHAGALMEALGDMPLLTPELYAFGLARRRELYRLRDAVAPEAVFWRDRPNVVSYVARLTDVGEDGAVGMQAGLDILHNGLVVQGPPAARWSEHLPFAAGVLDTALELVCLPEPQGDARRSNASLALERSLARGVGPRVETADDIASVYVTAADAPEPTAWYRVSLADGTSLGMMEGGGQATTDYLLVSQVVSVLTGTLSSLIQWSVCMARDGPTTAECVGGLVCGLFATAIGAFVPFTDVAGVVIGTIGGEAAGQTCGAMVASFAGG